MQTGTESSAQVPEARTAADPTLAISVLGEVSASRDGAPVDLGGLKQRAVLALLVLARGDVVPADRLVDSLWGAAQPRNGTGALHSYLSHLRRRLEPDRNARSREGLIARQGPGYVLRVSTDTVDAWRFERLVREASGHEDPSARAAALTEALGLWRGPAFADFAGEPWVEAEVARLHGLREHSQEQLLATRLDLGESAVLVPEIERLVAQDPLREERWRMLVLALYRAQRQADALGALRRARKTLADELGVDPGPALRELEREVLSQSPSLDAPRTPAAAGPTPPPPPPSTAAPAPPTPPIPPRVPARSHQAPAPDALVDRDREVDELRGCLEDAWSGMGRLALVEGPAGIGKSRLLTEVRRMAAEHDAAVLSARGSQMEREFGFGAVRQLFETVLADPTRRGALLSGAAASAAGVFDAAADVEHEGADGSFAVLHGLYWLTVNLAADGPVLLAVDDLQWCDTGSLRFFAYLLRRIEGLPVLLVTTLRTGEAHDNEELLAGLVDDVATVPVRPQPLSLAAVHDLVRSNLGEPADDVFVGACHRTTSGNPLLLRQLLRALKSDKVRPDASHADTVTAIGSRAVSSMVLMRLGRLPQPCTAVARSIAVLGDDAELPAVAELAGLPESEVATAVAVLARAEVLRDEYPLGFVHPLIRDAVYRDLPPGEREMQHQRAARVLDATRATAEQIAAHLLQVPRRADPWVVDMLRAAAATAAKRGASEGAAAYLTRALAEPPDAQSQPHVLVELGRVEVMVDGPAALQHLREAYDTLPDERDRAAVAQMLARTMVFAGGLGEATSFARRAAAELSPELVDERQGLLALERISGFMHGLDEQDWRRCDLPEIVGTGPGARMLAAESAWERLIDGVGRDRCLELCQFALEGRELLEVDAGLLWVVAAMVQEMCGEDTRAFWDEALAYAFSRGSLFASLSVHLWRGYMLWRRGELREAQESLETANRQTKIWGAPAVGAPYGEAFVIGVMLDRGDVGGAREYLDAVRRFPRLGDGARLFGEADAKVLYAEGRHAESLAALDSVRGLMTSVRNPVWRPWRSLRAHPTAGLGRRAEAAALVEEELRLMRVWGAPSSIGRTLRMLAELRDDPEQAAEELREAIELLSATHARLQLGRAHHALARLLPDDEAVPHLQQALALAWECGAQDMHVELEAALRAVGVDVAPHTEDRALTTRERRVATMAAAGADVRAIAQELFLTPRTVEVLLADLRARGPELSERDEVLLTS
ncbi:MAG: BTAD domain-containing putative transcriptional regulator [Actinomycetes bacterium]